MADTQIPQKTLTHSSHTVIQEEPKTSFFSNIVAIIGFIILVTIVIWGLVNLAGISREWFASLFGSKKAAAIEVSAPATTTSGTPFTVSWKYNEPAKGTYAFLYQCRVGLQFKTSDEAGFSNDIPCGAAFTVAGTDKKFSVTPLLMGDSAVAVPLSIIFMPGSTSTSQAQGSATTTVVPAQVPAPSTSSGQVSPTPTPEPVPPAPTPTPEPTPAPQSVSTPADLSVRITSVSTDAADVTAVSFDIANVGGTSSGTYSFTANLPTQSGYTYASPTQASLAPGSHVLNTLRFTQAQSGVVSVSVNASDANKSNNYASQSVNAPYQYNSYNYNYQNTYYNAQTGGQYYTQPYQMYPYSQYPYSQTAGYPYYYQQQPYSTYYPYTY